MTEVKATRQVQRLAARGASPTTLPEIGVTSRQHKKPYNTIKQGALPAYQGPTEHDRLLPGIRQGQGRTVKTVRQQHATAIRLLTVARQQSSREGP
jgi:hypothetical protein